MKTWRPNQSGTFSNRTAIHATDDKKLFVVEFTEHTDAMQRLDIIKLITSANELLKAAKAMMDADSRKEIELARRELRLAIELSEQV